MSTRDEKRTWWVGALLVGLLIVGAGCNGSQSDESHSEHEAHQSKEEGHSEHEEHGGESKDHIELSAEALERNTVRVEEVGVGQLEGAIVATAKVKHAVDGVAHIAPIVEGQISKVEASLGDRVEAGEVVAEIRSVKLGEARAQVAEAEAMLEVAQSNFEREKKLHEAGISSERSFVEARGRLREARAKHEAAKAQLETYGVNGGSGPIYPVRSQIEGTIIEQHATRGETKGPNDELFVVADQSKVWVVAEIYEQNIADVHEGKETIVTLDAYPGRTWSAKVDWVSETVDETTRTLPVRVVLENPDGTLKPGMFGKMRFARDDASKQPLIPIDAVQKVHGSDAVFVPGDKEGVFHVQPVEVGEEADGMAVVKEGLEPGDKVVTKGAFDLRAALTASERSAAHSH